MTSTPDEYGNGFYTVSGDTITVNDGKKSPAKSTIKISKKAIAGSAEIKGAQLKITSDEAGANIVPEDKMLEAIFKCHEINQTVIAFIDKIVAECGKPKFEYQSCAVPEAMFEDMKTVVTPEQMEVAVFTDDKQTREKAIDEIKAQLISLIDSVTEASENLLEKLHEDDIMDITTDIKMLQTTLASKGLLDSDFDI